MTNEELLEMSVLEQESTLDKIRSEIQTEYENIPLINCDEDHGYNKALEWVLDIIDKYKAESEKEKDVTNEELLEMSILVRDLTELNKNLKKQIAMNEIKISKLNEQLNKYQFQLKEGKIVQNEISD